MKFLRYFLPIAILAVCGYFTWHLLSSRPEPARWNRQPFEPEVEVSTLELQDYQIVLQSQGIIEARTQSALIPEVRGRILSVSPSFRPGGFFEKGELLVEIDPSDYETELVVADATLAQMELRYAEEKVRADRAALDWKRLGNEDEAPELVLRLPQMRQAQANLASAQARVKAARLNLERTKIVAPYAGRILEKQVDVGQYVSPGNRLATIYAIDFAEIRLPLSEAQLGFIDLPESYRDSETDPKINKNVRLRVKMGDQQYDWNGKLVRAEGAFDQRSRQLYVVAQIPDPYGSTADGRPPLKVGSFAIAHIPGNLLRDVFVIPRRLLRESSYVILIDGEDRLVRRHVSPIWADEENIVVGDELKPGERLCLTPVKYATSGMKVRIKLGAAEAEAKAERDYANFIKLVEGLPQDLDLPIHLEIQIKALKAGKDKHQSSALTAELIRWARQNDIEIPKGIERGEPDRKDKTKVAKQA
ncbi:efflux RND transporter periplasmic adaptor subunit [Pelagicoccus enzymogenes]|uniref:efflux RND transporter periplasmic adaptor subunit n=1 Tax=Pelagicoccus enzymogenes TaxID=2773457 RepID=UPI00280E6CC8|nr:efflux RND transporter periplasmic adaptor subunit [Pelagicoccus enzymogenes]MDQ8200515.1 efflux RND transporter periplasmic adaptor subunit [Pelagicoccus enzymogenes]